MTPQTSSPPPSLGRLTEIFFRIGNTTFGGGYVTIGMLGRELVETRRWITSDKFDLAFALARVTPGTNLIAFCAAVAALISARGPAPSSPGPPTAAWRSVIRGFVESGVAGAIVAVLAVTVPSAAVAVFFIYGFEAWQTNTVAMAIIGGTVAAVAGMMWSTIWTLLRPHVGGNVRNLQVVLIAGGAFLASWYLGVTPLPIIGVGTLAGFLWKDPRNR